MGGALDIKSFCLGEWMTNCYVVHVAEESGACWIVDAGFEPQAMVEYIQARRLKPQLVVLTHAHVDHIAGLCVLRQMWPDLPILIHPREQEFLVDPMLNLSIATSDPITAPQATAFLTHAQRLVLDGIGFEIRHTPGHSPGGVTLYQAEAGVAIVGDTLFAGSVGRYDFPTSDSESLMKSVRTQLLTLPDQTRVLPGHGAETTIGQERRTNPFLREAGVSGE